ncbi:MAG: hypothetical protein ACD_79C00896G0004 [uncultured bacterium]|nr:MAG: hypothetical protein ACD_79C00896G0004 [uncultured bacterium]
MAFIDWTDSLSVGINLIDEQHKKLVGLVNSLYDAMKVGKGNDVLGKILEELIEYTKYHFSTEEELMKKHLYPKFLDHKKEHDALTKAAVDLAKQHKEGAMLLSMKVNTFLKDWLTNHIMGTDKKYSPFFIEKGLK